MLDYIKNQVRIIEAHLTPRQVRILFRGNVMRFRRSAWWVFESQAIFDEEIAPYFECIERTAGELRCIVDAGAATGLFSIAASRVYPTARFVLFEPSVRQHVLLRRNLRLNKLGTTQAHVFTVALWDREESLSFRSIGAMSTIEQTSLLAGKLAFSERVNAIPLDDWSVRENPERIDLIKMDIEGAEIEAIRGARKTLARFKPELLIMAYHERDGVRTFERCANELTTLGYRVTERLESKGFLHAVAY